MMASIPTCQICKGSGRIRAAQGFFTIEKPCPACNALADDRANGNVGASGYVYILLLASGILKIGHTKKHPEDRADEWGLELLAYARTEDSADAEKRMHQHLSAYRRGAYELFEISFKEAVSALERVVGPAKIVRHP
jgi:hypothetical protein